MYRLGMVLLIFLISTLGATLKCSGGAIVQEHLQEVREVALRVDLAGLRFDPIRGVELQELEREICRRLASILTERQIGVVQKSEREVVVTVDKSWGTGSRDQVALLVELELLEPVRLGAASKAEGKEIIERLSTWRERRVSLVKTGDAIETLLEEIEIEATEFADKVVQAKAHSSS
jgi:hypothetical protein